MEPSFVKLGDVEVYRNESTYVAPFGSLELLPDGSVLAAFREADRRRFRSHIDPSSRAMLARSVDGGRTWDPRSLLTIHRGPDAVQDPSVRCLRDGTVVASFFKWRLTGTADPQRVGRGARRLDGRDVDPPVPRPGTDLGADAGEGVL